MRIDKLYTDEYFSSRNFSDKKRLKSFDLEGCFIREFIDSGVVCDVGCSTGEFLKKIDWSGDKYGMEVNDYAINIAKENGFSFDKNILNQVDFFDLVIFRGTIQHLPNPFLYIENAYNSLKKGGLIVFLSTPNANSIYYKIFNNLPFLDSSLNFYIPSDTTLNNSLSNFGFDIVRIEYPYLKSPYARPVLDYSKFILKFFSRSDKISFAFPGSMMNVIAIKR